MCLGMVSAGVFTVLKVAVYVFGIDLLADTGAGIRPELIEQATRAQQLEIERRETAYRGDRPQPQVKGKLVILVDDGIATGATMRVAVQALRQRGAATIVVAVPVAPGETIDLLRAEADEVVCLAMPGPFHAVGVWYADFRQVSDDEVRQLLERAWRSPARAALENSE